MKLFKINLLVLLLGLSISIHAQSDTADADLVIFNKVEVEAYYPGGEEAWRKYLEKNLNASTPINNNAPSGYYQVWVQFIVSSNGNISDVKALTNLGYGMEAEVMRIIRKSGKWEPAHQDGRLVKAYRKQPVTFVVMDDGFNITTQTPHVLFTGIENAISIDVPKLKDEHLMVTIKNGSISKRGPGSFIVKVSKPGRVIIEIYDGKKNKKIGAESFEVRAPGEESSIPTGNN